MSQQTTIATAEPSHRPHFGFTRHGQPVHLHANDYHPDGRWYDRVNKKVAIFTTKIVGTMWCAYVFALFDCLALPTALRQGLYGIVQWVASFFLQLVLLSVIMVGQNLASTASDARAAKQFQDLETVTDWLNLQTQGGLADVMAEVKAIHASLAYQQTTYSAEVHDSHEPLSQPEAAVIKPTPDYKRDVVVKPLKPS